MQEGVEILYAVTALHTTKEALQVGIMGESDGACALIYLIHVPSPHHFPSCSQSSQYTSPTPSSLCHPPLIPLSSSPPHPLQVVLNKAVKSGYFTQALRQSGYPHAEAKQALACVDVTPTPNPKALTIVEVAQMMDAVCFSRLTHYPFSYLPLSPPSPSLLSLSLLSPSLPPSPYPLSSPPPFHVHSTSSR